LRKAQIISMDFILTFVLYLFALSVFFFAINDSYFSTNRELDVNSEILFSKISNIYNEYSFLDDSKVMSVSKFDIFLAGYNPLIAYEHYFQSFESTAFSDIDYCIYLQNGSDIIRNFEVYSKNSQDYSIIILNDAIIGEIPCGTNKVLTYEDAIPYCKSDESIVVSKPVLFEQDIVQLKVLMCGERA
jgi:hypothetical protein